ncbi:MAG: hypothetical protein AB7Q17_12510 [Phycisphaerae bacterium]
MKTRRVFGWIGLAAAACANLGGCPMASTCDESNLLAVIPAIEKINGCGLKELTSCDVLVLANAIETFAQDVQLDIGVQDADAVVEFIHANNLVCLEDIERLLNEAILNPGSVVIPDSVFELLIRHANDFAGLQEAVGGALPG